VSPVSKRRNHKNQRGVSRRSGNPAVRARRDAEGAAPGGPVGAGVSSLAGLVEPDPASRAWWPVSFDEVLDAAAPLSGCAGPEELEEATAEVIGGVYHGWLNAAHGGHELLGWMDGLVAAAGRRTGDPGVRSLLHGLAAICPARYQPAVRAALQAAEGEERVSAGAGPGGEPSWLPGTASLDAEAPARLLVDAYRCRYGLLVRVVRPAGAVRTYLIDVDPCSPVEVPVAGMYGDEEAAVAAWRGQVGPSADGVVPGPVTAGVLAELLSGLGLPPDGSPLVSSPLIGDETPRQLAEYHRMRRIGESLAAAMRRAGTPLPVRSPRRRAGVGAVVDRRVEGFLGWCAAQGLPAFEHEPVSWIVAEWTGHQPDPEEVGVSPHRVVGFVLSFLSYFAESPERDAALEVLPHWLRYCAVGLDLPPLLADPLLDVVARVAADPAAVAGGLGDELSPPPVSELGVPVLI
jgi:hypothetical protein